MAKGQSLADRIRAEIRARGLTAYRVHKDTGMSEATVHRFMREKDKGKEPTLSNAEKLIEYLGWEVGPAKPAKKGGRK